MDKLKNIGVLIKPSSSLCNLRCKYCFYIDVSKNREVSSYGFISRETSINLIENLFDSVLEGGSLTFNFQGGEPSLIGLDYYKFFVGEVNKRKGSRNIKVNYALQTNGTLIDEKWAEFFYENNFLIGVSIDGFKDNNDKYRVDNEGVGQFERIVKGIGLLKKYKVNFNILTVLTNTLSHYPLELYNFYKENNFEYVQIIPCLSELGNENKKVGLKPKNFSNFYKKLFDIWYEDRERINISLFNDIFPMLMGIPPLTCGMLGNCAIQLVIEGDGGVYPCDFYVIDKYRLGNINDDNLIDLITNERAKSFLKEDKRMSNLCDTCNFYKICRGNCKRLNITMFEKDYCGYKNFLEYSIERGYKLLKSNYR